MIEESIRKQLCCFFTEQEIESLARESKFVQRSGQLGGFTFLCLLAFNSDALAFESLNDLTVKLELDHDICIKKQSLDERFNQHAVSFLTAALAELFSKKLAGGIATLISCDQFERILIKDSVCFQIDQSLSKYYPGSGGSGSAASVRIQFEYDLVSGSIVDLSLNAFNDQDATNSTLTIDVVREGDLVIRDLAYMHLSALRGILQNIGDFLCRLQANKNVYQLRGKKKVKLHFSRIVRAMANAGIEKFEDWVFLDQNLTLQVRLFVYLLPESVYQERMRKAHLNAQKKGRQLGKEFKARARLNLFITSASEELLNIQNAWKAYTLRWQIELVFKTWKSLWKIDKVKKVKKQRLECYIYSKLFIIVLSMDMLWIMHNLMRGLYGKNLSFYKALKTWIRSIDQFKEAFFNGIEAVTVFLVKFLKLSCRKHLLEKKKNGNYSPEIIQGLFILRIDGEPIPCAV
nr:IS4 family transposase [Desulfobulbus rhabdoformis]